MSSPNLLPRAIEPILLDSLATRRVVVVTGPRQSGKTTLVRRLVDASGRGTVRSLDDEPNLTAARSDPVGFVRTGERPIVIDEVQRGGDALVRAVKSQVDRDPSPGQFVLTGSSNFLTVPTISESLAGRASYLELWPFTQGELHGRPDGFIDALFENPELVRSLRASDQSLPDQLARICRGGYPEVQGLPEHHRARWFADYVHATVQRDVIELGGLRKFQETVHLVRLLAARTACELVMQNLIADAHLERQSVYERVAWLETIHLIRRLPAWSRNLTSREARHRKVYMTDPGLAASLLGRDATALADPSEPSTGQIVETFVANELAKQATWSTTPVTVHHFRDRNGPEVDLVLESSDGRIAGVEVKKGATVTDASFRWLKLLRERLGPRFVHGIVLYTGQDVLAFGDRMTALPLDALWRA